ncbi:MAG TPA: hypothetical protein VFN76_06100, partial [Candidatus Limnocylindria bacterium]|nr:hypothetical protein [Candidatus Limnocylindria bacterium]
RRPGLEWLQLLVPIPAFAILLASIVPFAIVKPLVDSDPGGGLGLFALTLAAFLALSAFGIWGPDRARPNGAGVAILDLRLTFLTRLAIHLFFLGALVATGIAVREPMLLIVALVMLAAEAPLSALVHRRMRDREHAPDPSAAQRTAAGSKPAAVP